VKIDLQTKAATRHRILKVAATLFARVGWDRATTRSIATSAGIATGTLFNYFPSKEGIAATLISDALTKAKDEFERRRRGEESLEEDLFSYIWTGLRYLQPSKTFLGCALETLLSPLARSFPKHPGDLIRTEHLETVERLIASHGAMEPLSVLTIQLYWTLYLGVLAYWATDVSPKQEDTMALLDRSLKLFVASLGEEALPLGEACREKEGNDESQG
jgi:AcrR family transcriptional regulator